MKPDLDGDKAKAKKAVAWVKRTAKLAELAPEAQQAVKDGRIKRSAAEHIAEIAADAQRSLIANSKGKISNDDVRRAQGKPSKASVSQVRSRLLKAATGDGLPPGKEIPVWLRNWIEELANSL